ncbi:response regulator [Paenibacillus segetis]|uniref:AraC family transcriptional regulator n=1 Tax=Paenibacillus segetis TaxID=1325360 RepID=A0ABQ1Y4M1_9BACL|nr:response regulator [Paenibacillus segetis]GGH11967.1 AraC family transcriptional regulator [Paenibacillus segetis]
MINVVIADDELLMRIGLKSMINWEEQGFQIIGEAANGREALEIVQEHRVDLIITDIKMPVMDGLELIREASQWMDSCQYVILSCVDEFKYAQEALKLGAADYLIKSDIKQQQLVEVLNTVKKKITHSAPKGHSDQTEQYKQSVSYLKETLFKEIFSGFREEQEILQQISALNIAIRPDDMLLFKLRVDQFETIRTKYVEKDEKLLRYAVVNILEEMIPKKWAKEIIIENSAEYLLVMNIPGESEGRRPKEELNRLFDKITLAMKDFLNISFSVGVSSIVPSFSYLKTAYKEADLALRNRFFAGSGKVIYYEHATTVVASDSYGFILSREDERALKTALEGDDYSQFRERLEVIRNALNNESISETVIRNVYIRVMELISSRFPGTPPSVAGGKTLYEQLLGQETFQSIHDFVTGYLEQGIQYGRTLEIAPQSYADSAIAIIMRDYAVDISLQSVATQINVNPSYLSRIFKQETGGNFINFLTKVRIDKAKYYLEAKNFKVYEVAEKVGYPNTTYFSKIFKKIVGVTPEEYRG